MKNKKCPYFTRCRGVEVLSYCGCLKNYENCQTFDFFRLDEEVGGIETELTRKVRQMEKRNTRLKSKLTARTEQAYLQLAHPQ